MRSPSNGSGRAAPVTVRRAAAEVPAQTPDPEVFRRPRVLAPLPEVTAFEIPAPPAIERPQPPQLPMILVPALTTASILIFGIVSKQTSLIFIGVVVTAGAMVTPWLMYLGGKRSAGQRNERRRQRYTALLDDLAGQIDRAGQAVRVGLETAHPAPDEVSEWITTGRLWERRRSDPDFLDVAVGVADIPSGLTASVGRNAALDAEAYPDLEDRAQQVTASARELAEAPLCLSLREHSVVSIEGARTRERALGLATEMLLELVTCCGYDELSLLVVAPPDRLADWRWLGELPHALPRTEPGQPAAGLVTTGEDLAMVLAKSVGPRQQVLDDSDLSMAGAGLKHLVIVIDEYLPVSELQRAPLLHETLSRAADLGVTVLTIPAGPGLSPPEASVVLDIGADGADVLRWARSPRAPVSFRALKAPPAAAATISALLDGKVLITDISFADDSSRDMLLDLIGFRPLPTGPPSWPRVSSATLLTATFGVRADGQAFTLNLKEGNENGVGPHGLLVGATGSGKSELLRSLVTSLALTHSPDVLQMAFVDFKGGAAFDSLAKLPHCVGLITNILDDPSLIERMRAALTGELLARQRQLAEAGPEARDIRGYRALRATRPELPPMPYLLLVIDEFGELLETDPDFLDVLLAVGRQGRSLGIHLVLSSQRLEAGRIRGLESHLSFRIALRTFNADDSSIAIGSKHAAELPPLAGHGYFRAAETFVRFKASQVSADLGGTTDLDRVVDWLDQVPKAKPLWLPPLPRSADGDYLGIDDERLAADVPDTRLPIALGLLDDPQHRRQDPFIFDLDRAGGHLAIVGAPQSGKSSALATLLLQAARSYPQRSLRFFILDLGGGLLAPATALPNVGAYATLHEPDRIARVMLEMVTLLDDRAADRDGAGEQRTMLLIDNYAAFKARFPQHEQLVERLLIEGGSFGLHVGMTSPGWGDITARKLDQIATRIELRLNDPSYSQFGRVRAAAIQASGPGRGLISNGRQLQLAAPILQARGLLPGRIDAVAAAVADQAAAGWGRVRTPRLRMLADLRPEEFAEAARQTQAGQAFLGVSESGLHPVSFVPGTDGSLLLFGDPGSGRTATLARLLAGTRSGVPLGADADVFVVDVRGDLAAALGPTAAVRQVAASLADLDDMVKTMRGELEARMAATTMAGDRPARPIVLVVDDYDLVQTMTWGKPGSLQEIASYQLVAQRVRLSVVICQIAANSVGRGGDLLKRALESGAWRMHFCVASRADTLPGNVYGRKLPPGVADLIRPGSPDALIRTLSP